MTMSKQLRCTYILLTTAAIWGFAYVAQKLALGSVGPLTLNTLRGFFAWVFLIPCRMFLDRYNQKRGKAKKKYDKRTTLIGGIRSGIFLCLASVLQAYGIAHTEVGKAGFLTTLYIIMVPIFGIFLGRRCSARVWLSVAMGILGMWFLCVKQGFYVQQSDFILILCAVFFAMNIISIDLVCAQVDNVRMSTIQFFVSSMLTLIPAICMEGIDVDKILAALPFILYSGIFSNGIGYTIEIIGQEGLSPAVSALILSFESVFSLLMGWMFLHERLSGKELIGCGIVIAAVIMAQLPARKGRKTG